MKRTVLLALAAFAAGYFLRGELAPRTESTQARSERQDAPAATPTRQEVQRPVTPAGGTVRGRVTADNKPLSGVLVVATHSKHYTRGDGLGAPEESGPRHEARTGADGAYELTGLDDAVHRIWPYREGYRFIAKSAVGVRPGATVDFAGERVVKVEVDVLLPDETRPEFASLHLKGGARERHSGSHTYYQDSPWIWVVPGRYEVRASANGGYAAKPRGLQAEDGARWVFQLEGTSRIWGDIRLPTGFDYVKAVTVYALPFKGETPGSDELVDASLRMESGGINTGLRYHLNAEPGRYLVGVAFGDYHDVKPEILASTIVEVADSAVKQDFDIPSIESEGLIAVRVTAGGKPVPEIKFDVGIELKNSGGSASAWWIRRTDETYLVRPYHRRNMKGARDYVSGFARGFGFFPRAYFRRGTDRELSIELRSPAFVRVHVLGWERGRYEVIVRRKSGQGAFNSSNHRRLSQDGDVDLGPVQPGAHWLTLTRDRVGLVVAEAVELAEGENRFEIKIPKLHKVTILLPDPIFSVNLVFRDAPRLFSRFARPEDGKAVFENVPAGAYVVNFQGRDGAGSSEFDVSGPTEVNVR